MTHPKPLPPRWPGVLAVAGAASLGSLLLWGGLQVWWDRQQFSRAMLSYSRADCAAAVDQFTRLIDARRLVDAADYVPRSWQKKGECEFLLAGRRLGASGRPQHALQQLLRLDLYAESALHAPAREQVQALLGQTPPASLASPRTCPQIQTALDGAVLPRRSPQLPPLLAQCGRVLEEQKKPARAISLYQHLLKHYPQRIPVVEIQRSLARATVAEIQANGAGLVGQPAQTASSGDGFAVLEIRNVAPGHMRLTFSGATPKFEPLGSCTNCQTYIQKPPASCPSKGPIGRYRLAPGHYDVAAKYQADDGQPVRPWAGRWNLKAGAVYGMCFFIVRDPVDDGGADQQPGEIQG